MSVLNFRIAGPLTLQEKSRREQCYRGTANSRRLALKRCRYGAAGGDAGAVVPCGMNLLPTRERSRSNLGSSALQRV
jgi:hypothetical protein